MVPSRRFSCFFFALEGLSRMGLLSSRLVIECFSMPAPSFDAADHFERVEAFDLLAAFCGPSGSSWATVVFVSAPLLPSSLKTWRIGSPCWILISLWRVSLVFRGEMDYRPRPTLLPLPELAYLPRWSIVRAAPLSIEAPFLPSYSGEGKACSPPGRLLGV